MSDGEERDTEYRAAAVAEIEGATTGFRQSLVQVSVLAVKKGRKIGIQSFQNHT